MKDFAKLKASDFEARGHCRIDYTDPITGHVLERIEGDNHVFVDQFLAQSFQTTALKASLLLTNGTHELDTDLPYIPGTPIGYGEPDSAATGSFRGAYRSADSYINKIMKNQVSSLYVYDFLTSQIPDTIRYVGLTGAHRVGAARTPFSYRWPVNSFQGIYDIERMRLIYGGCCSLSGDTGGNGNLYCYVVDNVPGATPKKLDLFALCDQPDNYWMWPDYTPIRTRDGKEATWNGSSRAYQTAWGYDYENQNIVVKIMRAHLFYWTDELYNESTKRYETHYYYTYRFRDDFWVVNLEGTEVVKHFSYTWSPFQDIESSDEQYKGSNWQYYYHFWTGDYFTQYLRLCGDKLYAFSRQPQENYQSTLYTNIWYCYQYDITSGEISCTKYRTNTRGKNTTGLEASNSLLDSTCTLYCYKGYTWNGGSYYSDYGFTPTDMGVIPMYDVYSDEVYTQCPVVSHGSSSSSYYGRYVIEKGQSNLYAKTWNIKPAFEDRSFSPDTSISDCVMPFAYTAYKLPSDAPTRPENSAVTIAYGLTITW